MDKLIIKDTSLSAYEARVKLLVLSNSVNFENLASSCLRIILNLDENAISIGNSSHALSMNQKVQLLLDTKFFDKTNKANTQVFMSIRNQFMHNSAAKSFESCLSFLSGTDTFMENAYWKKRKMNQKIGGEIAAKDTKDEKTNNHELLPFNITEKEKLLYKSWISLTEDVIWSFEKTIKKIFKERKTIKLDNNKYIYLNFPSEEEI
ncbi:hypothetical protein MQE36_00160 [Zhouia spongiae]|uniref:DUF4145 domain-containing protein n=1 Tax=Zhouia spongiae TaxID=2202721 RepID=A0ABY3YMF6_9FLAO|nr:hypothetical protein [Zhouia spongiae]UNY98784.1 hypothetical protein MQE36_00160 [Zhouia spongiae]